MRANTTFSAWPQTRHRRSATPPRWPVSSRRGGRTAGRRSTPSRRPTPPVPWPSPTRSPGGPKLYVLDMFPYPSGTGLHVGHPLGYIGTDVYGRFKRMTGPQRAARPGLRRLRPARRAVRRADRSAPARQHRGEHRQHAPPAAPARPGPRPAPQRRPPPTRATTAGRSGSSSRSSTPGTTPRPSGPGPSPSWSPPFESGEPATPDGRPWAELSAGRAAPPGRRPPAGLPLRGAGELVPRPGHRAGQRGGHRRRPQRPRQLPGVQAQPAGSG